MDFENIDPEVAHKMVINVIPAVMASVTARFMDPTGALMYEVNMEQVMAAEEKLGLNGIEFGLLKLMASERVIVWMLNVMSQVSGVSVGEILMEMNDAIADEGVEGLFGTAEGR